MDEGGSMDEVSLSLKRLCGGTSSLGTLEDMSRRSPDAGISLCGGPFVARGNPVCGGARIPRTLIDEWRALVVRGLSARDCFKGTLRQGPFTGEPDR
jgi:hypothetical protein